MKFKTFLICWIPAFIIVFALNAVFHTLLAADFFDQELAHLSPPISKMKEGNPAWVALLDIVLTFSMTYFILVRQTGKIAWKNAAFTGGLINLISSGAWHFVNAAMFTWSMVFLYSDMAWHIALGAGGGLIIAAIYNRVLESNWLKNSK